MIIFRMHKKVNVNVDVKKSFVVKEKNFRSIRRKKPRDIIGSLGQHDTDFGHLCFGLPN